MTTPFRSQAVRQERNFAFDLSLPVQTNKVSVLQHNFFLVTS